MSQKSWICICPNNYKQHQDKCHVCGLTNPLFTKKFKYFYIDEKGSFAKYIVPADTRENADKLVKKHHPIVLENLVAVIFLGGHQS